MTHEHFEAIRKRAEKATAGPWLYREAYDYIYPQSAVVSTICDDFSRGTDAEFIANAREDIPALLAEVDKLNAEIADRETSHIDLYNENKRLQQELALYECYRGDVEYAMHKVGRNNDRIAEAEESLDEGLAKLNGGDA